MEIVYFVSFVAGCAVIAVWVVVRSNKRRTPGHERLKKAQKDLLHTPSQYTLSRPDQVWRTRRHSADTLGVNRTNAFVARSLGQDPEYDGYSRRDRHHVRDRNAHIKAEPHVEEPSGSSVDYKKNRAAN